MTAHPHNPIPRRNFIRSIGGITAGLVAMPSLANAKAGSPSRPANASYMGDFAAPKLDKIKCAFIGVGARGSGHASQIAMIDGTDIVGICDLEADRAKRSKNRVKANGHNPKIYTGDAHARRRMFEETKPDAVFISTPWEQHAEQALLAFIA